MLLINVKFQEEYKKLDALCKDLLKTETGVTDYINQMESTIPKKSALVTCFADDYKKLKHYRWVRNKLAHEVGALDEELCDSDDVKWIVDFSRKIKKLQDPLSLIQNNKNKKTKKREIKKAKSIAKKEEKALKKATRKKLVKEKPIKEKAVDKKQEPINQEGASLWTRFANGIKNLLKL